MAAVRLRTSCGLLQKIASATCLTYRMNNPAAPMTYRAISCEAAEVWTCKKKRTPKESVFSRKATKVTLHAAIKKPPPTSFISLRWLTDVAGSSGGLSKQQIKKKIDEITDMFMEARDLLADASAAKDTIYFHEDLEDATLAVKETLELYSQLLEQLTEEQRNDVVRTIGLKMEELKAQESMLQEIKK